MAGDWVFERLADSIAGSDHCKSPRQRFRRYPADRLKRMKGDGQVVDIFRFLTMGGDTAR